VNSKSLFLHESNPDFCLPFPRPGHFTDRATVHSFFDLTVDGNSKMASLSKHTRLKSHFLLGFPSTEEKNRMKSLLQNYRIFRKLCTGRSGAQIKGVWPTGD
jgi:hypothetical protein